MVRTPSARWTQVAAGSLRFGAWGSMHDGGSEV